MAASKKPRTGAAGAPGPEALFNPHDRFFAFTFGQKTHAMGLLRASLPPALTERLDWESLARKPADFVDVRLRSRYSDLLFSIRTVDTGEDVLVYTLVEHQSSPHPLMAYRMLRYLVRIWEDYLKAHPRARRLPLIVPLLIYHGRKPWRAARTLRDLLDGSKKLLATAAEHVPQFRFRLIDLQHRDADQLIDDLLTAAGRATLWALEVAGNDERVLAELGRMDGVLRKMMAQPDGRAALGALLRYLFASHERLDRNELEHKVAEVIHPQAGDQAVTVYEQLIEEGRAKALLQLLTIKFGPLPDEVQTRVKAASAAELTAWFTRVLTATTLVETLAPPPARKPARRPVKPRG